MSQTFNEIDIKTYLIDHLRKDKKNIALGVEVPYLLGERRVDVLQLYNNIFHAYEIKSDKDNLKKLPEQLEEYSSTFDFVSVVVTPKHHSYIEKNKMELPPSVGLIVFNESNFVEKKKPKENKLKKENLCYFLNRAKLNGFHRKTKTSQELSILRSLVSKSISTKTIKKNAYNVLFKKYSERYNAFLADVGSFTLPEDLQVLSSSLTF